MAEKDPRIIYASEIYDGRSALHLAAGSPNTAAVNAVRWLLDKGIPWGAADMRDCIPEDLARVSGNEESRKILREWAVNKGDVVHIRRRQVLKLLQNTSCTIGQIGVRKTLTTANHSP